MKEIYLPSTDGYNKLHTTVFEPKEIKAILQISHGMVEYIGRYKEFAEYLNTLGILVIGNEHLGHGLTAKDSSDLGYFGKGLSKTVVDDLKVVTDYAKASYGKDIPYFLLGHSMGSFMARRYIMTYGKELTAAIIMGTGSQPSVVLSAGKLVANILGLVKGERYRSDLLVNLSTGAYNKPFNDENLTNAWLTKDKEIVNKYNSDPFCTFSFTVNGYKTLFDSISYIQNKNNINKIPKDLPILVVSGDKDPVGEFKKGVEKVYNNFKDAGIKDLTLKFYESDRHEILNELDKETVYQDIYNWLNKYINN